MTYTQTLDYLYRRLPMFQRVGPQAFKKDLGNIRLLMQMTNHPHKHYPTIHIAGTNGKGSVSHILAGLLMSQGLRVGLYTSPHYRDFRERIKIDGHLMPKHSVTSFVKKYQSNIENIKASFFEVTVAMAFDYFAQEKVDVAIIETGLGGRLDSTNVIAPLLSVITNISLDHQAMLGDTLAEIAGEKAGIIKPKTPVVIGENQKKLLPIFRRKAQEVKAPFYLAEKLVQLDITQDNLLGIQGIARFEEQDFLFETDVSGTYQSKNLLTAFAAYSVLIKLDFVAPSLPLSALQKLRKRTHFVGRWSILGKKPLIIADSAHNEAGLKNLAQALQQISHQKMYFILGTVNDKDPGYLLDILPKEAFYHFAKAKVPRGLDAHHLEKMASQHGLHGKSYTSVRRAFAAAKRKATKKDLIVVAGSIFVIAEVI